MTCEHQAQFRRRRDKNGRPFYVMQCAKCGDKLSSAMRRPEMLESEILDFDDAAYEQCWRGGLTDSQQAFWKTYYEQRAAERARWRDTSADYYRSNEWARRREAVLARAGYVCEGCRSARATQAHHLTYENFGGEFLWELVAVCTACHNELHARRDAAFENERAERLGGIENT